MALVFQYGSNCSDAQINSADRLCGDAVFAGIAHTLDDYELAFDVYSSGRACAASNIVRKPGGKVWGVLYDVPDWLMDRASAKKMNRKSFDAIEGEGTNYRRVQIEVVRPAGAIVTAITYLVMNPQEALKTNVEYVRHIVNGLRERGIDAEYVDSVKSVAARNNQEIAESVLKL